MISIRLRKKYLFYALSISSSIISAVVVGIDSFITVKMSEVYSVEETSWVYGFSAFLVGLFVTLIICLILSIKIRGRSLGSIIVDPSFDKIRLISKEEVKYHLVAGLGNAITTVGYFYVLTMMIDPSAILPFFRVVILYLLLVEMVAEKNTPTLIEIQSSIIVTFGAILGSISISGELDIVPLAVMFLIVNPGWVLFSLYQRKLKLLKVKDRPNDSINIRLWNLLFTLGFVTLFIIAQDYISGTSYLMKSIEGSIKFFWLVALSMAITFFSYVFYIRALGIGKASITEAVRATIIIFSIPVTFLLSMFVHVPIPHSPVLWLIKIIGIILVILGILSFALTQVTAYIFIKAKPGISVSSLSNEIWKIRGIESVAVVTGRYDIIAKVRIRTLLKGYERIIRRLDTVPGVGYFEWHSVLKEWENI
ncbi:MAG TPA: Lrp/AsnC family transcriptional regulator [Thermoplasmatales archaeon]|nr:Lrp/AsnC family transcriptional regulator [Thermoplasmatales archaeon]